MTWPLLPGTEQFALFWAVLARAGGLFAAAPLLSSTAIPAPVRALFSGLVAVAAMPAASASAVAPVPVAVLPLVGLILRELVVGLAIGLVAHVVFSAAELAGSFGDLQLGLNLANVVDPVYGIPVSALGSWIATVATLAFVSAGGLELLTATLAFSYRHLPLGGPLAVAGGARTLTAALGWAFVTGLGMIAPLLGVGFVLNLLLGALSRAVPQFNVLQSVLPAQLLTGLVVLLLATPVMLAGFTDLVPRMLVWLGRFWA